jgi:squalene-hopene/tetraprenyl-beta-curcumene cyclase
MTITRTRLDVAYQTARNALMAERTPEGHWVGELSTSALSTATAVMALFLVQKHVPTAGSFNKQILGGLDWLAKNQNDDGGWGDTVKSLSNISTTMLCRAALYLTGTTSRYKETLHKAETWLGDRYGHTPRAQAEAVRLRYGKDRTFAVPILTTCALAGLVKWSEVPPLPFELACFPQSWFRMLNLHVVSYALPALIAIGQCIHRHRPSWNPVMWGIRWLSKKSSLRVLEKIQPANGGFLEAAPLTSFVTLSLASIGLGDHPVACKGVEFLLNSVRPDGSWPIDTNLSTWVTTLSINALATAGELENLDKKEEVREWLLRQQYREKHPYTGAEPGGWAWTPLPGGVPDADDTPGAIIALTRLAEPNLVPAAANGLNWLGGLQNSDGGWPTFCRGWGHLPFDRSGSDLTAHALRAFSIGKKVLITDDLVPLIGIGVLTQENSQWYLKSGMEYLARHQVPDGSWLPLWFGNQHAPDDTNPTYGTARVLAAYRDLQHMDSEPAQRGIRWLLSNQNDDGGWGGCKGTPSSLEETALAVEILLDAGSQAEEAVNKGVSWLVEQVEAGELHHPTPIGFYFAKLWYFEKLYPIIFTVAALGRARQTER